MPPDCHLPEDFASHIPDTVLADITFLSYLNKDFVLCEALGKVEGDIFGEEPCWQKRWAGLLSKWKQSPDTTWQEASRRLPPSTSEAANRTPLPLVPRALREIHLSPNVRTGTWPVQYSSIDGRFRPLPLAASKDKAKRTSSPQQQKRLCVRIHVVPSTGT